MNSSSNTQKWRDVKKARKNPAKNGKSWKAKGANAEGAGKYFFDSYKVESKNGKVKECGKYFCNCEELTKLMHKPSLTKKEDMVLKDMARRYNVCFNFARGWKCFEHNCPMKHSWFGSDNECCRQAALELKFTKSLCKFCKERPVVAAKFGRRKPVKNAKTAKKSWKKSGAASAKKTERMLDTASTAGSTMSTSTGSAKAKASTSIAFTSNPKALVTNPIVLKGKKPTYKAEEYPSLKAGKLAAKAAAKKSAVKALKFKNAAPKPKAAPKLAQNSAVVPEKKADPPLTFSELSGTNLHQPIGAQQQSTRTFVALERTDQMSRSGTPSEASLTSMADSSNEVPQAEVKAPKTFDAPLSSEATLNNIVLELQRVLLQKMEAIQAQNVALKAENDALKAENVTLKARIVQC